LPAEVIANSGCIRDQALRLVLGRHVVERNLATRNSPRLLDELAQADTIARADVMDPRLVDVCFERQPECRSCVTIWTPTPIPNPTVVCSSVCTVRHPSVGTSP
jgi:hypothetical protein